MTAHEKANTDEAQAEARRAYLEEPEVNDEQSEANRRRYL